MSYHTLDHAGTLEAQTSNSVEDIHHPLCLEPLQQDADSNKRPSPPTATTVCTDMQHTYNRTPWTSEEAKHQQGTHP